jgi:hypothetical protein
MRLATRISAKGFMIELLEALPGAGDVAVRD